MKNLSVGLKNLLILTVFTATLGLFPQFANAQAVIPSDEIAFWFGGEEQLREGDFREGAIFPSSDWQPTLAKAREQAYERLRLDQQEIEYIAWVNYGANPHYFGPPVWTYWLTVQEFPAETRRSTVWILGFPYTVTRYKVNLWQDYLQYCSWLAPF